RAQLLLPVLLLLAGVAATSAASAYAASWVARNQIEHRLRGTALTLDKQRSIPFEVNVLRLLESLTGAHILVYREDQKPITSFPPHVNVPVPDVPVADAADGLSLTGTVRIDGVNYLCGGARLHKQGYSGYVLYVFYPESLWVEAR